MIGRAAIGNPWIFREIKHYFKTGEILPPPTTFERVETVREHLARSLDWKGEKLGVVEMRRHYGQYFRGLPHFKPFRKQLVTENDPEVLFMILDEILDEFADKEAIVTPLVLSKLK